jgi:2-polyprenyl-3-methyl-5-hydroxy-6-metoxy-1,4-benzoquinol methylase
MTAETATTGPAGDRRTTSARGRTPEEYARRRAQARVWEDAAGRLLDRVGLAPGASCLDAGCGPGEVMRLMAQRVGPAGHVVGIDVDAPLGEVALRELRAAGHAQCAFAAHDVTAAEPLPGAPYDLVFARLLLFHLPQRLAVLRRLWDAVAPGGHLVVQEYDLGSVSVLPSLASVEATVGVVIGAFDAVGCDVRLGARLPAVFAEAGVGTPDGTDVAGRLDPLAAGRSILQATFASVRPGAVAHGVTTEADAAETAAALAADATTFAERPMLWPLLVGAWKRKP